MNTTLQKEIGDWAEQQALIYLKNHGLRLLEQNFCYQYGEIDLIMQDKDDIVFVEVRARSGEEYGTAFDSVDHRKKHKLIRTAKYFLQTKGWMFKVNSRFDIIAIDPSSAKLKLEWLIDAFTVDRDI